MHAGYNFALLLAHDAAAIRAHLEELAKHPDHWPAIAFSNHDVARTASRFGAEAVKAMLALLLSLRGTALIYQGEELGLPEVDLRRDQLRDPVGDLYYPLFKGRDGCRTPMPWDDAKPNLGFTAGAPWLPLGEAHAALSAARQMQDPDSALAYARKMLAARRAHHDLRDGDQKLLQAPLPLIMFRRGKMLCAFNLGPLAMEWDLPAPVTPLDFGTGQSAIRGSTLVLGPWSAFFGSL